MSSLKIVRKEVRKRVFRGKWSKYSFIAINAGMMLWMLVILDRVANERSARGDAMEGFVLLSIWVFVATMLLMMTTERQTLIEERQSEVLQLKPTRSEP